MDQEDQKDQQVQEDDEDTNDEYVLSVLLASVEGAGGEVLDQPDPLGDLHLDSGSPHQPGAARFLSQVLCSQMPTCSSSVSWLAGRETLGEG